MRVLLMGDGDLAEEVCEALEAGGGDVSWLQDARHRALTFQVFLKRER